MTTNAQTATLTRKSAVSRKAAISPAVILFAGWLIPGLGHLLLKKPVRAALIFLSIAAMFLIGMELQGKVYTTGTGDPLDLLGFAADLGSGLFYIVSRMMDLGHSSVQIAIADYGSKFIVVAGLLNIVCAVDAHSLATGRKLS
jgi:hypothetical protein